jgi:hypothetical protein
MLREKVIITKLPITQAGQIQHFQVKVPRDAHRIIGVEVSAQYMGLQVLTTESNTIYTTNSLSNIPPPLPSLPSPPTASSYTFSSLSLGNIFQIIPDLFLGDVRLQSCDNTNVFFAEHIYYTDENFLFGDYSAINPNFIPVPETHGKKREICVVNTDGETTIIKGIYRDRQGSNNNSVGQAYFQYVASIYVWYETKITHE